MSALISSDDDSSFDRWRGVDSVALDDESTEGWTYSDHGSRFTRSSSRSGSASFPKRSTASSHRRCEQNAFDDDETILTEDSHFVTVPRSAKSPTKVKNTNGSQRSTRNNSSNDAVFTTPANDVFVEVIGGKYAGKKATFIKETEMRVGVALLESPDLVRYLKRDHVRFRGSACSHKTTVSAGDSHETHPSFANGEVLHVVGGKYEGETVTFIKRSERRISVMFEDGQIRYLDPNNVCVRGRRSRAEQRKGVANERFLRPSSRGTTSVSVNLAERTSRGTVRINSSASATSYTPSMRSDASATITTSNRCGPAVRVKCGFATSVPKVPSRVPSTSELKYETVVDVVGGTYAGKVARLVKRTSERVCVVFDDDFANVRYLKPSNVKIRSTLL
jgi:ribosomal protein L14E/L6E/L27E